MSAHFASVHCSARTTRLRSVRPALGAVVGILALLMQMLPALATSEDGMWIEICSDLGPVMMQIDAAETPAGDETNCPDCDDCTLCATGLTPFLAGTNVERFEIPTADSTGFTVLPSTRNTPKYLRPVTRGPPQGEEQSAACMPRLSLALIPLNGGAPWI